ncbi:hypothetical protein H7X87_00755 [Acetobacteraceae bacterium]|nr:hypothetical protein [Candidatus Parcubacteria bacterium]
MDVSNKGEVEKEYTISRLTNRIGSRYTPWILLIVGMLIYLFGEITIASFIGTFIITIAAFVGGKEYGHKLGFKDGLGKK